MELIDEVDTISKIEGLGSAIAQTGVVVGLFESHEDPVLRFLARQWHAGMCKLPDIPNEDVSLTRELLKYLGYLALIMERVGMQDAKTFVFVSANMLHVHTRMFGDTPEGATDLKVAPHLH